MLGRRNSASHRALRETLPLLLLLFLGACSTGALKGPNEGSSNAKPSGSEVTNRAPSEPRKEGSALASWYGRRFHKRRTASGERFDMNALTGAHRTLPFGSKVRIVNLKNGKSVIVRINDRGPFGRDRLIDVSYAAAKALGLVRMGVAPVEIEVLSP